MSKINDLDNIDSKTKFAKLSDLEIRELAKQLKNYRLKFRGQINIPSNVDLGIEIEFYNASLNRLNSLFEEYFNYDNLYYEFIRPDRKIQSASDKWVLKVDSSVCMYNELISDCLGGELATPIMNDRKKYWQELNDVAQILKKSGAVTNNFTSLQINIGTDILGNCHGKWIDFFKLWALFEKVIYYFGYGEQKIGRELILYKNVDELGYANPMRNRIIESIRTNVLANTKSFVDLDDIFREDFILNSFKQRAFDLYHDRLEIRTPNGSLNIAVVQVFVKFFVNFLLAIKNNKFDMEKVDYRLSKIIIEEDLSAYFKSFNRIYREMFELLDIIFDSSEDKLDCLKLYLK